MPDRPSLPSWFPAVAASNGRAARELFGQLGRGNSLEAHEAAFRAALDRAASDAPEAADTPSSEAGASGIGRLALDALLAGSTSADVVDLAIRFCLDAGLDLPLVEDIAGYWSPRQRLEMVERLFETVIAISPGHADPYAVKAVRLGSKKKNVVHAYMRARFRAGYFEELLAYKAAADTPSAQALLRRATEDTKLLRYGFQMPKPTEREQLEELGARRVLMMLDNSLPLTSVGYATRSHGLLGGISASGYDVSAVTRLGFPHDRPDTASDAEIAPSDVVDGISYDRLLSTQGGFGKVPITEYLKANILAHIPLIKSERPAILHAASNWMNGISAAFLAKRYGLKSIYEVRGLWEITKASRDHAFAETDAFRQISRMETDACQEADLVICVTEALKDEMVGRGVPPGKISVVPNGVDTSAFGPLEPDLALAAELGIQPGDVVIGYVGSMQQYEGLDDLLWAFRALLDGGAGNVRLLMVGTGECQPALVELADHLGIAGRTIFTGRVPHDQVRRLYSLVSIAPFPRRPLPVCEMVSPLKPLEAMAMSKCVIVSSVAALAEMVEPDRTGLIFAKGDADALAETLKRAVGDAALRQRLGSSARSWAEEHRDWRRLAAQVTGLYEQLAGAAAAPSGGIDGGSP